ncbi:MAG: restriction endonuclease subunit S [Bacteroidales bacterium]|jgi:type I restriction enzyme S subunit|nr:restriction endonuclease subunit S [Bacteroidales bacterium]MCI2146300.1 restriction endonuclease subunit S [Bacteroidales bacterium]
MSEWKEYKLGEIAEVQTGPFGSQLKNEQYITGGTPVVTVEHLQNFRIIDFNYPSVTESDKVRLSKYLLKYGDIVFTRVGTVDLSAYVKKHQEGWMFSSRMLRVRTNPDKVDSKFLSYFFQQKKFREYILNISVGATMPSINTEILKEVSVSYPSLSEQHIIASILSSLDDKIDVLQRQNTTLEKMVEALFRQWFVVKATGNSTKGKLGDLIGETVDGEWGKEYNQGEFSKAVRCIRGTDIADLNNGLAGKTPIRFIKDSKFRNIEPKSGDLILEISGGTENQSTGRVTYINNDVKGLFDYPIIFSNFCRLLRIKDERYSYFLYCYLRYLYEQNEFFNLENGSSGIKNLDYKSLLYEQNYSMPVDKGKIIDFYTQVKIYFQRINQNKKQIRTLTALRDTLLPKLMNGEMRVKNI